MTDFETIHKIPELSRIEELRGEQNYYEKIQRVRELDKLWKWLGTFEDEESAASYIMETPATRHDGLSQYLPPTEYQIVQQQDKTQVVAISQEIKGERLDHIDDFDEVVLEQLDDFFAKSLVMYEQEGVCPGVNFKNFIVDGDNRLYYVDSEPYPPFSIENFEMAHARRQKLQKVFGDTAEEKLPKTYQWIKDHEIENYKRAKSMARRARRNKS